MSIYFATYATSKNDLLCNYILANSIHEFAGNLSDIPLRIYVSSEIDIENEIERFAGLNAIFLQYPKARRFRYAFKSAAASACEADVKTGDVIWLDRHMIVLNPCESLLLSPLEQLAYRPPHLKILGASVDEPINEMWAMVYKIAGVDDSARFPVFTEVDRKEIWIYIKGDHFSFRAEAGIMREWDALFNQLAEHQDMKPFLDEGVKTYLHQIALTLAVLKTQNRNTLKLLPNLYGYPTGLHSKIEKQYQANQLDQLYTAYHNFNASAKPPMPVSKQLTAWLKDKVNAYKTYI